MDSVVSLDSGAMRLISAFEKSGFSIYAAGGCVRDALLNRPVSDIDLAVSATPEQNKLVLQKNDIRYVETGISHGTLTALVGGRAYEITTFRTDGRYSDNRRPDSVNFVSDIRGDLARRDFTVNAMAYNPREGIIDIFNGADDLKSGIIRAVGDPDIRFEEDSLRILRGLRFASVLNFEIESVTAFSMMRKSPLLKKIARERVTEELIKLLSGTGAARVLKNYRDIIFSIHSDFPKLVAAGTWDYAVKAFSCLPPNADLRLAALILFLSRCVNIQKKSITPVDTSETGITGNTLRSLRLKSISCRYIRRLMQYCAAAEPRDRSGIKRVLSHLGDSFYNDLLILRRAVFNSLENSERCRIIDMTLDVIRDIHDKNEVYTLASLDLNGSDLKNLGYSGQRIGQTLEMVLELVMDGVLPNDRDVIIRYLNEAE